MIEKLDINVRVYNFTFISSFTTLLFYTYRNVSKWYWALRGFSVLQPDCKWILQAERWTPCDPHQFIVARGAKISDFRCGKHRRSRAATDQSITYAARCDDDKILIYWLCCNVAARESIPRMSGPYARESWVGWLIICAKTLSLHWLLHICKQDYAKKTKPIYTKLGRKTAYVRHGRNHQILVTIRMTYVTIRLGQG